MENWASNPSSSSERTLKIPTSKSSEDFLSLVLNFRSTHADGSDQQPEKDGTGCSTSSSSGIVVGCKELTLKNIEKYTMFAQKALEYYNCKEAQEFGLKNVEIGCSCRHIPNPKHHLNFTAQSVGGEEALFFADVEIPASATKVIMSEITVIGCCQLRKTKGSDLRGRRCNICAEETIMHPGPRYGYEVATGDGFEGADYQKFYDKEVGVVGNGWASLLELDVKW